MNPNVAITALATGDVDYCQFFGAVVGGAIAGFPISIVAGFLDNWPMTLIAQPEYKSLKELKGKTLGISSFGATPDVGARMMLKQAGLDPEKDIKVLALGSDAARLTALKQRVVDVVVISPPADAQMEKQGYKILARAYELFSFPYLGLGTHTKKIKEKPEEIRRAIKATIRANRFIRENREQAVRTLVDWGKVERDYAYASYDALRNLFNADGSVPEDGLKLVIDQARRNAKVAREVTAAEVADLTFPASGSLVDTRRFSLSFPLPSSPSLLNSLSACSNRSWRSRAARWRALLMRRLVSSSSALQPPPLALGLA